MPQFSLHERTHFTPGLTHHTTKWSNAKNKAHSIAEKKRFGLNRKLSKNRQAFSIGTQPFFPWIVRCYNLMVELSAIFRYWAIFVMPKHERSVNRLMIIDLITKHLFQKSYASAKHNHYSVCFIFSLRIFLMSDSANTRSTR